LIGEVDDKTKNLVKRTEKTLYRGIDAVKPGKYLYEIGKSIEKYICKFGYSIVQDYADHGIGREFHEGHRFIITIQKRIKYISEKE